MRFGAISLAQNRFKKDINHSWGFNIQNEKGDDKLLQ